MVDTWAVAMAGTKAAPMAVLWVGHLGDRWVAGMVETWAAVMAA
jgi:hypothetical protein